MINKDIRCFHIHRNNFVAVRSKCACVVLTNKPPRWRHLFPVFFASLRQFSLSRWDTDQAVHNVSYSNSPSHHEHTFLNLRSVRMSLDLRFSNFCFPGLKFNFLEYSHKKGEFFCTTLLEICCQVTLFGCFQNNSLKVMLTST